MRKKLIDWARRRPPNLVIGGEYFPYLLRWFVVPRNPVFNIYLHLFLRGDDHRALHDHPWANCSIILAGEYLEHRIAHGGIHTRTLRRAGDWHIRPSGKIAHRIELVNGPCWTLFMTGPIYRRWGFHCPDAGWVDWEKFTAARDGRPGEVGRGCDG